MQRELAAKRYTHLHLLWSWVGYFAMYFLTENLIPRERCHVIHCTLDDLIPFCEWFLIAYVFWYFLVAGTLAYFGLRDADSFKKLQVYIIITQVVAMLVYVLYPSCQNLRPTEFARDNALIRCVEFLYCFDTNTGVCPSLHCAYSFGIASVCVKAKSVSKGWKAFVVVVVILICMSTVFIKQHSVVDILAAIPVGILAEVLVFRVFFKGKDK